MIKIQQKYRKSILKYRKKERKKESVKNILKYSKIVKIQ
jgi:hypothetical protein